VGLGEAGEAQTVLSRWGEENDQIAFERKNFFRLPCVREGRFGRWGKKRRGTSSSGSSLRGKGKGGKSSISLVSRVLDLARFVIVA